MLMNRLPDCGDRNGFTLIELVVVLAILMALATTVGLVLGNIMSDSKEKAVIVEMRNMKNAILQHYKDTGIYPPPVWTLESGQTISGFYGLFYDFGPKEDGAISVTISYQGVRAQVSLPFTDADDTNQDGIPQSNEFCNISLTWTTQYNADECLAPPRFNSSTGFGWNGPYIDTTDPARLLDPWNEPYRYYHQVGNLSTGQEGRLVALVSSGPDKNLSTNITPANYEAEDDDVVMIVYMGRL